MLSILIHKFSDISHIIFHRPLASFVRDAEKTETVF